MIIRTQITFSARGTNFIPSKLSAPFTEANDPQEIGKYGRYRGIPIPYGKASIDAPEDHPDQIAFLHNLVIPLLPALRRAGAQDFDLQISYHSNSESIGFSREEIKMLADFDCDVPINCFPRGGRK